MSRIHPALAFYGGTGLVLAVLIATLAWPEWSALRSRDAVIIYCAASQRPPVELIVADYERETGRRVEVSYAGSQSILSNIEMAGQGDLFLPADDSYIELARQKGLIAETIPIARMNAVVVVPADNPKKIAQWGDLLRDGVTLAQAEPDVAAIGKLTRDALAKSGRWELLKAHTRDFKVTVNYVANDVALKAVDAGIVWDAVARMMPELKIIELPELAGVEARIQVAVLATSKRPLEALRFARFLAAADRGLPRFRECGFARVEPGEPWEPVRK